jgi:hypothetical protein
MATSTAAAGAAVIVNAFKASAFFTKSNDPFPPPGGAELVNAGSIRIPD